jgi:hypothetical protein
MHTRVTRYELKPGRAEAVLELVRNHWIDDISQADGFVAFEMIETDADELIGMLTFQTEDQSLNALEKAKEWVFTYMGEHLASPSVMYMGTVQISTREAVSRPAG